MRTVELLAGIGGFRQAADALGWRTVWANGACPEGVCCLSRPLRGGKALRRRLREAQSPLVTPDLLTAGFPCQPFSSAGKKRVSGTHAERSFSQSLTSLPSSDPGSSYWRTQVLADDGEGLPLRNHPRGLADLDYALEWRLLNAVHFGLPQNPDRVFLPGSTVVGLDAAVSGSRTAGADSPCSGRGSPESSRLRTG